MKISLKMAAWSRWFPYWCWSMRGAFVILVCIIIFIAGQEMHRTTLDTRVADNVNITNEGSVLSNEAAAAVKTTPYPSLQKIPLDPLYPPIAHGLMDHLYYSSSDGGTVYENRDSTGGTTRRRGHALERKMFDQARDKAIEYLKVRAPTKYTRKDCRNLRYRTVPTYGMEVDVMCRGLNSLQVDRVTLEFPMHGPRVVFHSKTAATNFTANINIIMPLAGRINVLKLFLDNLKRVTADGNYSLGLTVVYFKDEEANEAKRILQEAPKNIPGLKTHFLLQEAQRFSRSKGLKVGVEQSYIEAPVVFMCDVDVLFTRSFLDRCFSTPVESKQVFFPMVFSQYNPSMVSAIQGEKIPKPLDSMFVKDNYGYWRVWGHGMMCLYKTDFTKIDGFDPNRKGWGGEDIHFLSKTAGKKYKVIRSIDHGLFHHYHPKNCSDAGASQSWPCARVRAMTEGSSLSYGLWFFRHSYNSSSWGLLKEKERWEEQMVEQDKANWQLIHPDDLVYAQQMTLGVLVLLNMVLALCLVQRNLRHKQSFLT